jgi:hypothetical protein
MWRDDQWLMMMIPIIQSVWWGEISEVTEIVINPGENRVRDLLLYRMSWSPHTRNPMITFFAPYLPRTCLSLCCSVHRASSKAISCLNHRSSPSFLINPDLFVPFPTFFRVCAYCTCVPLHIHTHSHSFHFRLFYFARSRKIQSWWVHRATLWISLRLHP